MKQCAVTLLRSSSGELLLCLEVQRIVYCTQLAACSVSKIGGNGGLDLVQMTESGTGHMWSKIVLLDPVTG